MKIQRYKGVEDYDDRSLPVSGYSEKKQTFENVRSFVLSLLFLCILTALETTCLSRIPLPILPSGSPALGFLMILTWGYTFGEKQGCICGLVGGIIIECAEMEPMLGGIMILPLVYCIMGYASGVMSKRFLAGNVWSFEIYALMGLILDGVLRLLLIFIKTDHISFGAFLMGDLLPRIIISLLFAPAVYGIVYLYKKIIRKYS